MLPHPTPRNRGSVSLFPIVNTLCLRRNGRNSFLDSFFLLKHILIRMLFRRTDTRYRSVRHPPAKSYPPPVEVMPINEDGKSKGLGRAKSMSRYRRARVGSPVQSDDNPPPMPTMSSRTKPVTLGTSTGNQRIRRVTDPVSSGIREQPFSTVDRAGIDAGVSGRKETEDERMRRKVLAFREREAQKAKAEEQNIIPPEEERSAKLKEAAHLARQQKVQAEAGAKELRLQDEETARLLAEQKRKDLERLEATLDAAGPRTPSLTSPKEKFNFFSRKRAASKAAPPRTSGSGSGSGLSATRTRSIEVPASNEMKKPRNSSPPSRRVVREPYKLSQPLAPDQMIQEGGGGIVPQIDAPISASNAGERVSDPLSSVGYLLV
jgi:hypothetical protein